MVRCSISAMGLRLSWASAFLFFVYILVNVRAHRSESEPALAICPGTCVSRETRCNTTLEGTHCGHDAKCCLDSAEDVAELGFDFSTLPTRLQSDEDWENSQLNMHPIREARNFEEVEVSNQGDMSDFFLDSAPQLTDFDSNPVKSCPGACIPKKHTSLCQYIVAIDGICALDKACCATKDVAMKLQREYQISDPSILIKQNIREASARCPGKCVDPSLAIFCDKMLPNYECPGEAKCCNRQLTTTTIPDPVECTGQCLPQQSTYFCHPPFQLVEGAVNCKESTICCMQVESSLPTESEAEENVDAEIGDLASDENGQLYKMYNGEFQPLSIITPEESSNPNFAYVSEVATEAGSIAIYKDGLGNLYQLSIIPQEQEFQSRMTFTESPEATEPSLTDDVAEESDVPVVSMPDDSDDMEENMKDIALPDEGEEISSKDPIPPGERTMIRPACPGSCISAFLKFTCTRNSAVYDGFSCPGRLVCCANFVDIEEHELYLKSLSPYFKAAQSVSQQHPECGISGTGHTFGIPATSEKWCWQAAVINEQNQYMCGAAIIDNSWVLTPAHCVTGSVRQEQSVYIRAGVSDLTSASDNALGQTVKAQSIFVHPSHNSMSLDNDLALIKLKAPFELSRNLCVVCLPTSTKMVEDEVCTVTGYGFLSRAGTLSLKLHEAKVSIVDDLDCIANVTEALSSVFILPSSSFCAGGSIDSCQGDAGGPLVCEREGVYELAGLVSWSLGCKRDDVPSIYVKISAALDWINQIISASTFMKALS